MPEKPILPTQQPTPWELLSKEKIEAMKEAVMTALINSVLPLSRYDIWRLLCPKIIIDHSTTNEIADSLISELIDEVGIMQMPIKGKESGEVENFIYGLASRIPDQQPIYDGSFGTTAISMIEYVLQHAQSLNEFRIKSIISFINEKVFYFDRAKMNKYLEFLLQDGKLTFDRDSGTYSLASKEPQLTNKARLKNLYFRGGNLT